jgi:DNA-binding HxlR family transcriptional regulator
MRRTDLGCWNVYNADCSARRMLDRIADKWTILVVGALEVEPVRFGALHRAVGGISKKVLTDVLRSLEADGLVARTVIGSRPPSVTYALTERGCRLIAVARTVRDWAEEMAEAD